MSSEVAKHQAQPSLLTILPLFAIAGLLALAGALWTTHLTEEGEVVAARVTLDDRDMGGLTPEEVVREVAEHADELLSTELAIRIEDVTLDLTLGELGFSYDNATTADAVVMGRRTGGPVTQFAMWATTPVAARSVDPAWTFDAAAARARLEGLPEMTPLDPVEPVITTDSRGNLSLTPGVEGRTVDIDNLVAQLSEVDLVNPVPAADAVLVPLQPTVNDLQAEDAAAELTAMTQTGVRIGVAGRATLLGPEALRARLIVDIADGEVRARFDTEGLQERIEAVFSEPFTELVPPVMDVIEGEVEVLEPGTAPQVCCAEGSAALLAEAVFAGTTGSYIPVELETRDTDNGDLAAWANGSYIVEQVSSFTTPHRCCETRVKNIQRIADIVNGVYIIPGQSLSLNEFVGPRTLANGFSAAGAIRHGRLIKEVGGGVSQFATTIFNAAYFAGLDFDEYRAHSIYFSRYPYGREATISNPAPDLVLNNTTDYPVLITTSYTEESITVSMYSTKHIEVEEIDQRVARWGACTHVENDRQRTYPDGRQVVDTVEATYRPAEGIDCAGNPIPQPGD